MVTTHQSIHILPGVEAYSKRCYSNSKFTIRGFILPMNNVLHRVHIQTYIINRKTSE
jgi:hypothetical protein